MSSDLNAQFRRWRDTIAHQRPHPEQRDRTVADVFAEEQDGSCRCPRIPSRPTSCGPSSSGKTPYVRFDRNAYSIPHTHVRRPLTLLASATTVRVIAGTEEIARHARSYDTGQTIEHEAHVAGLIAATRQANPSSARDRLRLAVPGDRDALRALGRPRRIACALHTARLLGLLDDYGPQELAAAVSQALETDALGAGTIAHLLEQRRRQRRQPPPIRLVLPDHPGVRTLDVTPHRLESYDALTRPDPDDAQ